MTDTQLPRWEVFNQVKSGAPHEAVGTVHAADKHHALHTARNVFGRRPRSVSMWVVPANSITSVTLEEIEAGALEVAEPSLEKSYLLFSKEKHRPSMTFVSYKGCLKARHPLEAINGAIRAFGDALVWWALPADEIASTDPGDVPSWFAPALDKTYKQQSAYGTVKPKGVS